MALIYGVETKQINKSVKKILRNFSKDTSYKYQKMSGLVWSRNFRLQNGAAKYPPPTAFPEKGLYMLATILKSPQATDATFKINGSVLGLTKKEPERWAVQSKGAAGRPAGLRGSGEQRTKSTPRLMSLLTLPRFGNSSTCPFRVIPRGWPCACIESVQKFYRIFKRWLLLIQM